MKNLLTALAGTGEDEAEIAFGCRKPNTDVGSWDGAFVYVKTAKEHMTVIYSRGEDFLGWPEDLAQGTANYYFMSKLKGWCKPMTAEDITRTSGAVITPHTILEVPPLRWGSWLSLNTVYRIIHCCILPV